MRDTIHCLTETEPDQAAITESVQAMVAEVHKTTKDFIKRNKFVTLFGGEHSVSIGAIRAFNELFDIKL